MAWRVATVVDSVARLPEHTGPDPAVGGSDSTMPDPAGEPTTRFQGLTRVERYRVVRELGRGGMGTVFEAYDPTLDRPVALKLLRPHGREGDADRARLLREAKTLGRLSHRNVVSIYDVIEQWGAVFIAMELVEGTSLRRWLEGSHEIDEILAVFLQAGEGLAAAHAKGIVHRDFKPANVLVGADGVVRVCDFGIALARGPVPVHAGSDEAPDESEEATTVALSTSVIGTPQYMAPEQRAGRPLDARADQFSYCVALYEALCGFLPQRDAHRAADLPVPPAIPPSIARVVQKGMAEDPAERFRSMPLLLRALRRARSVPAGASEAGDEVAELDALLAQATTLEDQGELEAALALAEQVGQRAQRIDATALAGSALRIQARVLAATSGDFRRPEELTRAAMVWAARGAHLDLLADLWVQLLRTIGYGLNRYDEVRHLAFAAELAVSQASDAPQRRARLLHFLGQAAWRGHDYTAARRFFEEARTLLELEGTRNDLAHVLNDLAMLQYVQGAYTDAVATHLACLDIWLRIHGPDHPIVAHAHGNLGNALLGQGRLERAQVMQERALDVRSRTLEPDSVDLAISRANLGEVLMRRNRLSEAARLIETAREVLRVKLPEQPEYEGYVLLFLAHIALLQGDVHSGRELAGRTTACFANRPTVPRPWRALGFALLAHAAAGDGDPEEAWASAARSREVLAETEEITVERMDTLEHLEQAHLLLGDPDAAIAAGREAVRAAERFSDTDSVHVGRQLALLARAHLQGGRPRAAAEMARRAVRLLETHRALADYPELEDARQVLTATVEALPDG